jgi:hypothetical protein
LLIYGNWLGIASIHSTRVAVISKARVFASIGIREADAEELRTALVAAASGNDAQLGIANVHGQRYIIDFDLFRKGRAVRIRSTWIVRIGDELPRLTSCYVL